MIIKLDNKYHNKLMNYLKQEPEFNLFIIGYIDRYGYNNYFFNIWADINNDGEIEGILAKYFEFITIYSNSIINIDKFYNLIKTMSFHEISGKSEIVDSIAKKLRLNKIRRVNFCKLENSHYLDFNFKDIIIKKIKIGNLKK